MKWLAALLLAFLCAAVGAQASVPEVTATCRVEVQPALAVRGTADGVRPDRSAPWQPVTLTDDWTQRWPGYSGTVWYRIDWERVCDSAAAAPAQIGLAIEFLIMAGEVFVNDDLIWRDAQLAEPLSRSWNMPRFWRLPQSAVHHGINTVWVRVVGVAQQSPGLGPVSLGRPQDLESKHDDRWWRHRTLFLVNLVISAVMGGVFLCMWTMRRDQSAYGWYALMALFWVLFVSNVLAISPWPFSSTLAAMRANNMALTLYIACFCVFIWRFSGDAVPRAERALGMLAGLLVFILAFAPDDQLVAASVMNAIVVIAVYILTCIQFSALAWRTRLREHVLLAGCLSIFMAASVHDVLLVLKVISDRQPLTPFTSVVSMLGMSAVLALRHATNMRRIERFSRELAIGIESARRDLGMTLEREHGLALANSRMQERLQIAHDLHDGLGGSLVRMMAMVEQATVPLQNRQVLSFLKLIRDDLRQSIDSGSSTGVRVPETPQAWLAPLRHRFVQLFDELGIHSDWKVPDEWRVKPDALQCLALTRLVEEALVNVLKHSRARRVHVLLQTPEFGRMLLHVEDDGVGFDVAAVQRAGISVGMRSMQARIARLGGKLVVVSQPGQTVLTIDLPLGSRPA